MLLELLRSAREDGEGAERHGDEFLDIRQEVLGGVSSLPRAHADAVSDWEHRQVGLVDVVDQLHVAEDVRVASVVNPQVVVRDTDHEAAGRTAGQRRAVRKHANRRVVSTDHPNLAPSIIDGAAWLHLLNDKKRELAS